MSLEDCWLREVPILGSLSERVDFFQFSPNLGVTHTETNKFGSVLICIGKPKVSVVGESGHGSPPSHSFITRARKRAG